MICQNCGHFNMPTGSGTEEKLAIALEALKFYARHTNTAAEALREMKRYDVPKVPETPERPSAS